MIYPAMTELEWGIVGIISIIVLIWGIRVIVHESQTPEPQKEDEEQWMDHFKSYCDEETRKLEAYCKQFEKGRYGDDPCHNSVEENEELKKSNDALKREYSEKDYLKDSDKNHHN